MKIRFIKDYRMIDFSKYCGSDLLFYGVGRVLDLKKSQERAAQWLVDNGFAERIDGCPRIDAKYWTLADDVVHFLEGSKNEI